MIAPPTPPDHGDSGDPLGNAETSPVPAADSACSPGALAHPGRGGGAGSGAGAGAGSAHRRTKPPLNPRSRSSLHALALMATKNLWAWEG